MRRYLLRASRSGGAARWSGGPEVPTRSQHRAFPPGDTMLNYGPGPLLRPPFATEATLGSGSRGNDASTNLVTPM